MIVFSINSDWNSSLDFTTMRMNKVAPREFNIVPKSLKTCTDIRWLSKGGCNLSLYIYLILIREFLDTVAKLVE